MTISDPRVDRGLGRAFKMFVNVIESLILGPLLLLILLDLIKDQRLRQRGLK